MKKCICCKFWSVNAHGIGFGTCVNTDRALMLLIDDRMATTWDYGCVLHELGYDENKQIYSSATQDFIIRDFLQSRKVGEIHLDPGP